MCDEMVKRYKHVRNFLLIDYKGLKASGATQFRSLIRQSGNDIDVLKNSVAERVFDQLGISEFKKFLRGMNAVAYGDDIVSLSKGVISYKKKNKVFDVKLGFSENKFLSKEDVEKLSELPSREELWGQTIATISTPVTNLVRDLNGITTKLLLILQAIKEKNSQDKK